MLRRNKLELVLSSPLRWRLWLQRFNGEIYPTAERFSLTRVSGSFVSLASLSSSPTGVEQSAINMVFPLKSTSRLEKSIKAYLSYSKMYQLPIQVQQLLHILSQRVCMIHHNLHILRQLLSLTSSRLVILLNQLSTNKLHLCIHHQQEYIQYKRGIQLPHET